MADTLTSGVHGLTGSAASTPYGWHTYGRADWHLICYYTFMYATERDKEEHQMNAATTEQITVNRWCSWHPTYFKQTLMMGTMQVAAQLGSFGSHGVCEDCAHEIRVATGLVK